MKILHLNRYYRDCAYNFSRYYSLNFDSTYKINVTDRILTLTNGTEIHFKAIEKEEDIHTLVGLSVDFIIYDDSFPDDVCKHINARIVK